LDNDTVKLLDVVKSRLGDPGVQRLRTGAGYFFISGIKALSLSFGSSWREAAKSTS